MAQVEVHEVKKAIFSMHSDKSPGPDGMSPGFYQKFWNIGGDDLVKVVRNFFTTGTLEKDIGDTNIVLISKKKETANMADLRPISLCNVVYKIISKVLPNRLKSMLGGLISETQSTFIPGRLITDNIMVSYEVMHFMKRKTKGKEGWMSLKLDMSKAYDHVECSFLRRMLRQMGFETGPISLIMECVCSAKYQICHAGRRFGNIVPQRGIRQGDPISSYLFLICMEGLSVLLQEYERRKLLKSIQVARGAPQITHMFFADDTYIFCKAKETEADHVLDVLKIFESSSGQKIKARNSSIFFSRNTDQGVRDVVCNMLNFREADAGTKIPRSS